MGDQTRNIQAAVRSKRHGCRQEEAGGNFGCLVHAIDSNHLSRARGGEGIAGRVFQHIEAALLVESQTQNGGEINRHRGEVSSGRDLHDLR